MAPGRTLLLVLGLVMVGLGLFVALRPLFSPGPPLTRQPWLDIAFAVFFILRGGWNVRTALRRPRGPTGPTPGA